MPYDLFSEEVAMTFQSFRISGGQHQSIFPGCLSAFLRRTFSTFIHRDQITFFSVKVYVYLQMLLLSAKLMTLWLNDFMT